MAPQLRQMLRGARWRAIAGVAAIAGAAVLAVVAIALRVGTPWVAVVLAATGSAIAAAIAAQRARRRDRTWLLRRLNAGRGDMDDSADLLFADDRQLAPLQRLQRARLLARLPAGRQALAPPPLPWRWIGIAWALASILCAFAVFWPATPPQDRQPSPTAAAAAGAAAPRIVEATLHVAPPAYTGLPARDAETLAVQAPAGSTLRWTLRFSAPPDGVALRFHDGGTLPLVREGESWTTTQVLARSTLYRIVPTVGGVDLPATDEATARLWRLDAVADRPPRVRVLQPADTLTMLAPGQRRWDLRFEAEDDHGIAADATLRLTLALGTGENITFVERSLPLRGDGDARTKRYAIAIDPVAQGLAEGGDLVAQLEVGDNRAPQPQRARSPSLILRWPVPAPPDADGLEGLARDVLPAYFRSQRQVIIDAEALLREKPRLAADTFATRSDTIGVDQRLLRLRYGQFLGEESEGGRRPLPTADADDAPPPPPRRPLPIDDYGQDDAPAVSDDAHDTDGHARDHGHDGATAPAGAGGHDHDHDHDHGPGEPDAGTPVFGRAEDVLAEFGHTHDLPEAATLLDPKTRELLRGALREMWQSELHLRQAAPDQALPYANRALELIKQVQQADRIYLARVGQQLPPVDPTRRLGGDRDGIAPRRVPDVVRDDDGAALDAAWTALLDPGTAGAGADTVEPDLDALEAWLRSHPSRIEDPLALVAAIDALRREPACDDCRQALRAALWTALRRPPPAVLRRAPVDAAGARYLDGLRGEAGP
ncbi:DUF4175 domain-containing protein [Luteimonas sp. BDR2-5]|uniref:DUF4175 domain-containing protein n=1 Tax=Proluteimonas luteida TaxID=2878685 RepID=UPI001E5D7287|nr:DUF4175 domain-containing protein [Luteimonas sp. BDR2-5]MCD9029234.1 DUF4175 domain-containing protein [Luteimonas sp. BDR2-5]